ncbi:alpha/beta fold hydrolase [Chungangia koreensis]|uniref:Alpha/beta fold hydrolase n=1 Tax=Chungangia koreensis TaxID=752657 RepID=A0ABV8X0B2_9LACT
MIHHTIEVEGKTVSYTEWGEEDRPVLVCLHGLAGSAFYSFSVLQKYLSEHFRIIAIDQPGHGLSDSLDQESDYLFSNLAKWYKNLFAHLNLKSFYLAGHSWGADVALHFTKYYPEMVKGLILLDGAFTFPHLQEGMTFEVAYQGWNQYMDNAKYQNREEIFQEYRGYTKNWTPEIEQSVTTIFTDDHQLIATKFTVLSIIKSFFTESFLDAYPQIDVRVLLIHATRPHDLDAAREVGILKMKKEISGVTVIPIEAGHMLQWDEPEKVAAEIIKFANK